MPHLSLARFVRRRARDAEKMVTICHSKPETERTHMATRKIAVLVGSLRKESFTRKVAKTLMLLAPPTLELEIVEIGQLPLYNQDDETDDPPAGLHRVPQPHPRRRRRAVLHARIQPLDAGRAEERDRRRLAPLRPGGLERQAVRGVVSVSPGAIGGFGANHHLRQMPGVPEHAVHAAAGSLRRRHRQQVRWRHADRRVAPASFLQTFIDAFAAWVERHAD